MTVTPSPHTDLVESPEQFIAGWWPKIRWHHPKHGGPAIGRLPYGHGEIMIERGERVRYRVTPNGIHSGAWVELPTSLIDSD